MPDYHVTYRVTHPTEETDVTGVESREHAVDKVVQDAVAGGDTVIVLRVDEIVPPPPPPGP